MDQHQNFIGGRWVSSSSGNLYPIYNPARPKECLGEFANSTERDAQEAVGAAAAAARLWAETPGPERGAILFRFAQFLEESKVELGRIVTLEQGKALGEAIGETVRAASEARFMAGEASRVGGQTFPSERRGISCHTLLEPIGVVAAICPWNFPVVSPVRKIAPALAYGNTVVFKPSSATPWSGVYLTRLIEKAGLPPGVVNLVTGKGAVVGEALINDSRTRGISFTGSTSVGLHIYEAASKRLSRVQLELGGKNPAVVLECDDLDTAAREIVGAAFLCSGQRCTALSRVIVSQSEADALVERILFYVQQIKVGDGLEEGTTMGPLVSHAQLRSVDAYVRQGIASGCRLLAGGRSEVADPAEEGYYYDATVFDQVGPDSVLAMEEIFGPVLPVLTVSNLEEAISIANGTPYGLAASIFTSRLGYIDEFARRVESGMIHVNHGTASQSHVPFGGIKSSGQGAYSIGPTARDFFTNVKAVYVKW
jgi:alpha-ketoglutaric semialdehyde dehydrogenase